MYTRRIEKKHLLIVLLTMSMLGALISSCSSTDNNPKPSHYGVFFEQNGELIELQEQEIFDIPVEQQMGTAQTISDTQPTITIWRSNTNLDYLEFLKLNQYLGQSKNSVSYDASPKDDGIIEITPKSPLQDGIYCLIQGDPAAVLLSGWCFKIGSINSIQLSPTAVVNNTQVPAAIKATETFSPEIDTIWQECGSYEDLNDQVKTIECYESFVNAYPNFFHAWDNLARVYGNNQDYQKALDAQIQSLNVATTPEDRVGAYLGIGVYYYNLGQFASAIKNLEDGSKIEQSISANHVNVLVWLSRSYEANGQQQEACQSWKKALELARNINYTWANDGLTRCP